MHPLVRIVTLVAFAAGVAAGDGRALLVAAGGLAAAYLTLPVGRYDRLAAMVSRLRWLFVPLLVLYGWFTPGPAMWPGLGAWSPSLAGLADGAIRCAALAALVAGVHLLVETTSREALIGGLYGLLAPFRRLGLSPERVALRIVLTLEAVEELRPRMHAPANPARGPREVLRTLANATTELFHAAERDVEPPAQVDVPLPPPVPWWQWLYPAAVAGVLWVV